MSTYLTEKNLGDLLKKIFEVDFVNNQQIGRYRVDWYSPRLSIGVEFDGYRHYNDVMTQHRDRLKDDFLRELDVTVMRIPYFIQFSNDTVNSLLFFKGSFTQDWPQEYPHGFIDPKAMLPANFNEAGVRRFIWDLNRVQISVRSEIIHSLIDRAMEIKLNLSDRDKLDLVLPSSVTRDVEKEASFSERERIFSALEMNLLK